MTLEVYDEFNGTSGTDISAHTPDTDVQAGGWSDSGANTVELDGSGALKFASGSKDCWIDIASTNQWTISQFNAGGADNRVSVNLRRNTSALASATYYQFNFRTGDAGGTLKIYRVVAGSGTEIATTSFTISSSTTYSLEPYANGTTVDFVIDGTSRLSTTDSGISTGNYVGLAHFLYSSAAARFYDFYAYDADPAAGGLVTSLTLLGTGI